VSAGTVNIERKLAIEALDNAAGEKAEIRFNRHHNTPSFIRGKNLEPFTSTKRGLTERGRSFLRNNRKLLKIEAPDEELELGKEESDHWGYRHLTYDQKFKGLKVWGEHVKLHFDQNDKLTVVNGNHVPSPAAAKALEARPGISPEQAIQNVADDLQLASLAANAVKSTELLWWPDGGTLVLAYRLEVLPAFDQHWFYVINALNGQVIDRLTGIFDQSVQANNVPDLKNVPQQFSVWQSSPNNFYLIDTSFPAPPVITDPLLKTGSYYTYIEDVRNQLANTQTGNLSTFDIISGNANIWDEAGVSALVNARIVYNYYKDKHQRESIDDNNMSLRVGIHYGVNIFNAFWNGYGMFYGDGNARIQGRAISLAACLDVSAHEMTHGVIAHTANLRYSNQTGALNESFADVFGSIIEAKNWLMAEDCTITPIRSLEDPTRYGDPKHWLDYVVTQLDNGGVHTNSGIPNYAAYLTSQALGNEKVGRIYYSALKNYLGPRAQFLDARRALIAAAAEIGTIEQNAVADAWDQVGVLDPGAPPIPEPPPPPPPQTAPPLDGQDIVLYLRERNGGIGNSNDTYDVWLHQPDNAASEVDIQLNGTGVGWPNQMDAVFSRPTVFTGNPGDINCADCHAVGNKVYDVGNVSVENAYLFIGNNGANKSIFGVAENSPPFDIQVNSNAGGFANVTSIAVSQDSRFFALTTDDEPRNVIRVVKLLQRDNHGTQPSTDIYTIKSQSINEIPIPNDVVQVDNVAFDFSGDYIVFEATHCIDLPGDLCSNDGGKRYKNIGYLDLYNDEVIFLFPSQNTGFDYGYPRFTANNSSIVVMDRIDPANNQSTLQIYNIDTNKFINAVNLPSAQFSAGMPAAASFSGADDTLIYAQVRNGNAQIKTVPVASDWTVNTAATQTLTTNSDIALPLAYRVGIRHYRHADLDFPLLNFGEVKVGVESIVRPLSLRNRGNEEITITDVSVDDSRFSVSLVNNAATIKAFDNVTANVTFKPDELGSVSSVLTFTLKFAVGDTVQVQATLSGKGVTEVITPQPLPDASTSGNSTQPSNTPSEQTPAQPAPKQIGVRKSYSKSSLGVGSMDPLTLLLMAMIATAICRFRRSL